MSTRRPDNNIQLILDVTSVNFDPQAFDVALVGLGAKLVHWRSMRCPVGMIGKNDSRRPHEDHSGCSNGFLYTKAGVVTGIFTAVGDSRRQMEMGVFDDSTSMVTTPRTYDDSEEELQVAVFDRFYLDEENITVSTWELNEFHVTGRDRLNFPIVRVIDLVDAAGRRYSEGDYSIQDGQLIWAHGPGVQDSGRGNVYSIRYTYRPFFYVQRMLHEVRLIRNERGLKSEITRGPQNFILQREHVALKEEKDDQAPDPQSPRQVRGPATRNFGPR